MFNRIAPRRRRTAELHEQVQDLQLQINELTAHLDDLEVAGLLKAVGLDKPRPVPAGRRLQVIRGGVR
ncbi:MAG: hypothetical protein AUG49_15715 [Catenulispora sp. 13_1_20CM_3_70_7]|nr:MAG: hypothetical protein AUG49_15715 [Catenulispora sp. 13_1_20CM_3_70_7]